ncbi:outer membrane protein with beta-barrel domain [Dysgonomonas alginatilytica]|uniref:Outer membrane protein with beta-barrel domain n=1 Tax=Dysgonomonas alginatilytica TaxID=1605892 RepID=A0A2V3PN34_9BACT|nr:outer membrane beta-barrel protein [Dysgonomonas alginatilytica]PXV63569.1 outer membrane protein with beta-barrel domain [Dysgonomonas alginatilytica]
MSKKLFCTLLLTLLVGYSFASDLDSDEPTQKRETLHDTKTSFKDFRFSVGGGYARRLGKKDDMGDATLNKLLDKVQNQVFLEIDGQYFFKETWGIGLSVNNAFGSGDVQGQTFKTNLLYVGPTFSMRFDFDKFLLLGNIGFGPLFYGEDYQGIIADTFNKTTLGFQTNFGAEYKLNRNLGLGIKLGWISGSYNLEMNGGEDYRMNLSNFNIGTYLSFRTW